MNWIGPYIHRIDPVLGTAGGLYLWWYGASFSLGFLNAHLYIRRKRRALGLSLGAVYTLSLFLAIGVLLGGRTVEVLFYEWPFYSAHPHLIPAVWLGGMATHGLLFGGLAGVWLFCRRRRLSFLRVTDVLAIPAAFILAMGRIGNFIDGQIVGRVTDAWWAVRFPDAEGFRHPVVLYDGLKNLLLIPVLLRASARRLRPGAVTGLFLLLYAGLRVPIDVFREYPTTLLGLATGQSLNLLMATGGLILLILRWRREPEAPPFTPGIVVRPERLVARPLLFALLIALAPIIPSDWTQDIPARYGKRHPGMKHSALYPVLDTAPPD
ncbi:MAG TPA: prolipoprotein diacylglyceryl transferase [Kiritimatiellia bacterium]|nr:prolipoprotein diacylglyceryl transferase [Kiritimatiellia bacterium]HRZ13641.1 prolipoprotein diacylglyceryl transferase [Kiritimatiellia bacterium]HSA19263.1 prolipoprotein diacylglyceryl transferase [Kiritimatiellia bacterium]